MKIDNDSADCYSKDLRMYIVSKHTTRELNSKRTKKEKQKLLKIEQFLRNVCRKEKTYEALKKQCRNNVTRNEIKCVFVSRAVNELRHIVHLALFFRTDSEFHCLFVHKIFSRFYFTMTVVDMIFIHFYRSSSTMILSLSLKSSLLSSADTKRNAILQRDRWDKPFKTNREIKSQLQDKITAEIKIENEDIFESQRHE